MGNESKKAEFLSIAKWACKYAGVRVVFDSEEGAYADVNARIIHMPKRMAVDDLDHWIATLIHESMHVKHTPVWFKDIPRDKQDHTIMNAIEDERIERLACRQLRAYSIKLRANIDHLTFDMTDQEHRAGDYGMQVLGNFACQNSGRHPFYACRDVEKKAWPILKALQSRHNNIITKVTPSAFKLHLAEYYKLLDELKAILNLKDDKQQQQQQQQKQEGKGECNEAKTGEKGEPSPNGEASQDSKEQRKAEKSPVERVTENINRSDGRGPGQNIDMEGMAVTEHSIPINDVVRERIKTALRKSTNTTEEEGNCLDTDELTSFMTGSVDDLFFETVTEKKMKTKVYFLMDTSGSMGANDLSNFVGGQKEGDYGNPSRLAVAHGAFVSLQGVVDELKEEDGCDIETESFVFATVCQKWERMEKDKMPNVGGGTNFYHAMEYTMGEILKEDPSNKRILIVLTDGDVSKVDIQATEKLILSTGQDIRVVFVRIGNDNDRTGFFRHTINNQETADIALFESFEEAI